MTGPLRGELRPWQLLGEHPDPAPPNTETLRGGRRLNRGADPMTELKHVTLRAEIEIGGVRYSHHYAVPARSWEVADDTTRQSFRDLAREGLANHLANELPMTITEEASR